LLVELVLLAAGEVLVVAVVDRLLFLVLLGLEKRGKEKGEKRE